MDLRVLLLRIAMRLHVNLRSSTVQQVMYRCDLGPRSHAGCSLLMQGEGHTHLVPRHVCLIIRRHAARAMRALQRPRHDVSNDHMVARVQPA